MNSVLPSSIVASAAENDCSSNVPVRRNPMKWSVILTPRRWPIRRYSGIGQSARESSKGSSSIQRKADERDAELLCQPDHNLEHTRNDVGVLMRIKVAWRNASRYDFLDLCAELRIDVQVPAHEGGQHSTRGLRERPSSNERSALYKHEMAADVETRCLMGKTNRIVECIAICHQRGRRKNAFPMSCDDSCVYVTSEAEIIGVDYQLTQTRRSSA